jgi:cysteine synthase
VDSYRTNLENVGVGHENWPSLPIAEKTQRLESLVGNTALTPISFPDTPGTVWVKAELHNGISGSHYDRLAPMIPELIRQGALRTGDLVVDASSGSYANAAAILLAAYGIRSRFYVPASVSGIRTALAQAAGADLMTGPGYIPEASQRMNDDMFASLRERDGSGASAWERDKQWYAGYKISVLIHKSRQERRVYLNHSANRLVLDKRNMGSMAVEITSQMQDSPLDGMVFAIGNFASIASSVAILEAANDKLLKIGVEDDNNAPCRDEFYGIHPLVRRYEKPGLLGTSAHGTPVAFRNFSLLDAVTTVSEKQWQTMQNWFNETYPHLAAGRTSAAVLAVAKIVLKNMDNPEAKLGAILYDDPTKYDQ